ncbi:unnamed protein product, partial [Pleuronectes platessa]
MRIILPVFGGGDGGEPRSLRSKMGRMGRMRKLLSLRTNPCVDMHMDSEPGVWLRSFQLIDTDAQYELLDTTWSDRDEGMCSKVCSKVCEDGADLLTAAPHICPPHTAAGPQTRHRDSAPRQVNMGRWNLSMDPVQEWGEEEEDGALFGITLRREPVQPNSETAELATAFSFVQYHTVKVRRLKAATLERLVTHLLDPDHQEPDFTRVFLSTYRAFTSTSTLIELLFQRDDSIANLDNTVCPRSTLPPVIRLWLEDYSEDFHEPPNYQALRLICGHLKHRLCFRRLAQTAESLLKRLQEQDCNRSASHHGGKSLQQDPGDEEDGGDMSAKEEDKHSFMDFPVTEVSEQLTRLDADLFVRVVPFHCLGCVWSQRDKKESRNLAPTVRATIFQFNAITNRVITSLLCPSSPSPPTSSPISSPISSSPFLYPSTAPSSPRCTRASPAHRATIIERWITVAQECRELKNFSSLRAILSALQSNAVYRLKKTWAAISRESKATFEHLCDTFPDENCVLTTREILVEDDSPSDSSVTTGSKPRLCSTSKQMNLSSGVVPYLGTYLTVLTMLDTALTDTVE